MSNTYALHVASNDIHFGLSGLTVTVPPVFPSRNCNSLGGFATAGVPGFSTPMAGSFDTYRKISAHPTVALVMRIVIAPVLANSWGWSKKPGVPVEWLDFVRSMLEPMRARVLNDGLKALVYGFSAFEKIWETEGNRAVLKRIKPLLPEITKILVDDYGNFVGFRQQFAEDAPRDVLGQKAFLYTHDGECGNLYGRSRHENIRISWSQALQTAERLAQYQKKVAGVIAQLHYPEGTSRDAAGAERSNDWIAQQILEAVSMGRSVRFPNLFASMDDPKAAADLAGKSQWVLSQFDPGGTDHSAGLLNALANYDKLLFRGWLRPERVGLEAQHGTRADAKQHSETSVLDSELIDRDFASAFNAGVVDDVLTLNFGPKAKGAVWVDPSPISDTKTDAVKAVLTTLLGNGLTSAAVLKRIDVEALLEDLDVPTVAEGKDA